MRVSTLDLLYALIKTVPDLSLYRVPSLGWGDYGMAWPLDKAPFNDVRVRQALSMAINRDMIAEVINKGDAAAVRPLPVGDGRATPSAPTTRTPTSAPTTSTTRRRPGAPRRGGLPNGFDLELEWAEFQGYTFGDFVQLLARFYGDVGVRVKLKQLETSTWLAKVAGVQPFTHMLATAQPDRGRPELHGLGVPALSRLDAPRR